MTVTIAPATPPASIDLREEAKAFVSSIALTAGFTAVYVLIAPVVLLGALMGGPLWAVLLLLRERTLDA